jgi:hypothetical protein
MKIIKWQTKVPDMKSFSMALIIVFFFLIECTTDATITHNRGLFLMMLLGLILSHFKKEVSDVELKNDTDNGI